MERSHLGYRIRFHGATPCYIFCRGLGHFIQVQTNQIFYIILLAQWYSSRNLLDLTGVILLYFFMVCLKGKWGKELDDMQIFGILKNFMDSLVSSWDSLSNSQFQICNSRSMLLTVVEDSWRFFGHYLKGFVWIQSSWNTKSLGNWLWILKFLSIKDWHSTSFRTDNDAVQESYAAL